MINEKSRASAATTTVEGNKPKPADLDGMGVEISYFAYQRGLHQHGGPALTALKSR